MCEKHEKDTSVFLGPVADDQDRVWWLFRCKDGHDFRVTPDPHAPKGVGETAAWVQQQKMARIGEMEKKRK